MAMSAKDYVLIARAFNTALNAASRGRDRIIVGNAAQEIAIELKKDNPRFDVEKFWDAVYMGKGL